MKIKDNLNLNGYILQNFCIDNYDSLDGINDKNKGRAVFLTGNGTNAGYGHVNVYDGTSFKALAYVDDVANNEDFLAVKRKVDAFFDGGVDADNVLENLAEVQKFLDNYSGATSLSQILDTKLDKTGGTISGSTVIPLLVDTSASVVGINLRKSNADKLQLGWDASSGVFLYSYASGKLLGIKDDGTPYFNDGTKANTILTSAGGTIENVTGTYTPLFIKTTDPECWIGFTDNVGTYYIGTHKGTPSVYKSGVGTNAILHSGNVGNYAVEQVPSSYYLDLSQNYTGQTAKVFSYFQRIGTETDMSGNIGSARKGVIRMSGGGSESQLLFDHYNGELYYRNYKTAWSDWKRIAFTDSTVDKAKTLVDGYGLSVVSVANSILDLNRNASSGEFYNSANMGLEVECKATEIIFKGYKTDGQLGGRIFLNSSGNVTIGGSDLASTSYKLLVAGDIGLYNYTNLRAVFPDNTNINIAGVNSSKQLVINSTGSIIPTIILGGNVLIGKTTDNGKGRLQVEGDLHVSGNIIADGEVSAGGAGEEGGGSSSGGGGAFHSEGIAVGATQTTIAHGLGTDDIVVSIYEKDGVSGRWSIILTDVEIVDANNIIVSFGSATTVEHKVVIMGAVA